MIVRVRLALGQQVFQKARPSRRDTVGWACKTYGQFRKTRTPSAATD